MSRFHVNDDWTVEPVRSSPRLRDLPDFEASSPEEAEMLAGYMRQVAGDEGRATPNADDMGMLRLYRDWLETMLEVDYDDYYGMDDLDSAFDQIHFGRRLEVFGPRIMTALAGLVRIGRRAGLHGGSGFDDGSLLTSANRGWPDEPIPKDDHDTLAVANALELVTFDGQLVRFYSEHDYDHLRLSVFYDRGFAWTRIALGEFVAECGRIDAFTRIGADDYVGYPHGWLCFAIDAMGPDRPDGGRAFGRTMAHSLLRVIDSGCTGEDTDAFSDLDSFLKWRELSAAGADGLPRCVSTRESIQWLIPDIITMLQSMTDFHLDSDRITPVREESTRRLMSMLGDGIAHGLRRDYSVVGDWARAGIDGITRQGSLIEGLRARFEAEPADRALALLDMVDLLLMAHGGDPADGGGIMYGDVWDLLHDWLGRGMSRVDGAVEDGSDGEVYTVSPSLEDAADMLSQGLPRDMAAEMLAATMHRDGLGWRRIGDAPEDGRR